MQQTRHVLRLRMWHQKKGIRPQIGQTIKQNKYMFGISHQIVVWHTVNVTVSIDWYADLTHWGQEKMTEIFQLSYLNTFTWTKVYQFRLRFCWSLFLRFELTTFQHRYWFRQWFGADQVTAFPIVCSTVCSGADKKNSKAPRHWPLWGNPLVTSGFPWQRASYAEYAFFPWRHYDKF